MAVLLECLFFFEIFLGSGEYTRHGRRNLRVHLLFGFGCHNLHAIQNFTDVGVEPKTGVFTPPNHPF